MVALFNALKDYFVASMSWMLKIFCPNPKKNYDCYHYFDKLNRFNIRDTFLRRKIIDMHALPTIVLLLSTNLVMATREIEPIYWNVNNKR